MLVQIVVFAFANACAVREHAKVALVVVLQDIAGECRVLIDNDDLCGIDICLWNWGSGVCHHDAAAASRLVLDVFVQLFVVANLTRWRALLVKEYAVYVVPFVVAAQFILDLAC